MNLKRVAMVMAVALFMTGVSHAANSIEWKSSNLVYRVYDQTGVGNTLLAPSSGTFASSDCFLQLIYAPDGNIYAPTASGNGVTGGNLVMGVTWAGSGGIGARQGQYSSTVAGETLAIGSKVFVRAWNTNSPDFTGVATQTNALIPSLGANVYYGDSAPFLTTKDPGGAPAIDVFYLSASFATDQLLVPEPGTIGLLLVGMGMLVASRRSRREG